ncbi:MAG: heme ABC transporter ATP-binding protein [Halobacteria archaeon]|nr:heme ABC transporter ATP-binding protein [Halobacteria archaeon]
MSVLRVEKVDVRLGDALILEGIDLSAEKGEFIGLIGPNGAGKTTLLRTINAVLEPVSGVVEVEGEDVHGLSAREVSRKIATLPQNTNVTFDFDVIDIVSMGRNPHISRFGSQDSNDRNVVERAMERTDTLRFSGRGINEISGGERQRVMFARALAQDTPVLLLDEPTASLDITHQVRMLELIRDTVNDEGKTVIAAIHDLNLAAHYCDKLVLLSEGSVLTTGRPRDVLTNEHLQEAFGSRAVVSRHPVTGSVYVTALPNAKPRSNESGRVHVISGGGTASRLLYLLSAAGYQVSTGALVRGDSDLEAAHVLGLETITENPFSEISEDTHEEVLNKVREADITVVADIEVGAGNLSNLEAALESENIVVVEERPFPERNYAGQRAREIYDKLCERGEVVGPDDVLKAVEENTN